MGASHGRRRGTASQTGGGSRGAGEAAEPPGASRQQHHRPLGRRRRQQGHDGVARCRQCRRRKPGLGGGCNRAGSRGNPAGLAVPATAGADKRRDHHRHFVQPEGHREHGRYGDGTARAEPVQDGDRCSAPCGPAPAGGSAGVLGPRNSEGRGRPRFRSAGIHQGRRIIAGSQCRPPPNNVRNGATARWSPHLRDVSGSFGGDHRCCRRCSTASKPSERAERLTIRERSIGRLGIPCIDRAIGLWRRLGCGHDGGSTRRHGDKRQGAAGPRLWLRFRRDDGCGAGFRSLGEQPSAERRRNAVASRKRRTDAPPGKRPGAPSRQQPRTPSDNRRAARQRRRHYHGGFAGYSTHDWATRHGCTHGRCDGDGSPRRRRSLGDARSGAATDSESRGTSAYAVCRPRLRHCPQPQTLSHLRPRARRSHAKPQSRDARTQPKPRQPRPSRYHRRRRPAPSRRPHQRQHRRQCRHHRFRQQRCQQPWLRQRSPSRQSASHHR